MASHKSAKKRIRSNERKRIRNKSVKSEIKTKVKKTLASKDKAEAEKLYKEAVAMLDKNSTKNVIHRNNAARKKSRLTKHLNSLTAAK